jgi:hypothetical protein
MKNTIYFLMGIILILTACDTKNKQAENYTKVKKDSLMETCRSNGNKIEKTLYMDYGFKVSVGRSEDFNTFKTYSFFELSKSGKTLYTDTTLEYEFGDKLFPIVLQTGRNKFELLFEVNDRPTKNYLKRLTLKEDKVLKIDTLPTFISKPSDLNHDGIKEYAGFWDWSEQWGETEIKTDYNPILYYKITTTGLQLDSLLTKKRNKVIYGDFYGYNFNERLDIPISITKEFDNEVERITNGK